MLAERISAAVRAHDWDGLAPGLRVGVTVGVAGAGPGALRRADEALLELRRAEEGAGPADAVREGESSGEPVPGRGGRAAHPEAG